MQSIVRLGRPTRLFSVFLSAVIFCGAAPLPRGVSARRLGTEILWPAVSQAAPADRPRVILVLGGGGARGFSHIGVLRALEEERIPIDRIVGVSMGAVIGSLYAAGLSVDEIETIARDVGWDKVSDLSKSSMLSLVMRESLMSTERMEQYLDQRIGGKTFADLKIPFACVATDIKTGERVVLNEGPVASAARASATLPGIFAPVEFRHRLLVDGGLVDNFPTDLMPAGPDDVVIGVVPQSEFKIDDVSTVFRALVRSIQIQRDVIMRERRAKADVVIEPLVRDVSMMDLHRSTECMQAGEVAARALALDIKSLLLDRQRAMRERGAL